MTCRRSQVRVLYRPPYSSYSNPILYEKGFGYVFVYERFAVAECNEAMKAPVGLSSDRTVLRSKMEGPRPDKFLRRHYSEQ